MKQQWILGLCAIASFSTVAGCAVNDPDQTEQSSAVTKKHQPPPPPAPACTVDKCVVGLEPDVAHGNLVSSNCACTEVDFWNLTAQCNAQGGILVDAGSCGTRTDACDFTTFNCVIPKPTTPQVVASECDCDEGQFWVFFNQCQGLGGEVSTVFPSGGPQTCTP